MKKILSLLVVAALVMGMCAFSASADALVTFKAVVDKAEIAVTKEVTLTVVAEGKFTVFTVDLAYNDDYVTYVADSLAYSNSVSASTTDSDPTDGTISMMYLNPTGATFAANTTILTAKFKALDAAAFEAAVGEGTSLSAIFDLEVFNDPKKGNAVFGKGDLGEQYAEGEFACTDATVTITLPPAAPTVTTVPVTGTAKIGETLTIGEYDYADINGDLEEGTTFQWYADGVAIEGATAKTYKLTAAEYDKAITAGVTPKTTTGGADFLVGEEALSAATEKVVANDVAAEITAAAFDGKFKVNKEVTLSYDFESENGGEDVSTIVWAFVDDESELSGVLSEDKLTYKFGKDDAGKTIKVTITPVDDRNDVPGTPYELVAGETIAKASSNSSGYTPNSGANLAGKTPEKEDPTDEPDEPVDPEDPEVPACAFEDVDAEKYAWAVEYINALAEAGIFKGRDEKTFDPDAQITRAEFVALVARVLGATSEAELAYADLEGHWAAAEVTAVAELGALDFIVDEFAPDQAITREEMATVLYKALVAKEVEIVDAEVEEFTDASSISEYAVEAVKALQVLEILEGMGDGTFAPKAETTRAQTAKVIYLFASLVK